ncbi:MAG: peptidylprolyl isomerase [Pseudomonadota bacterium]|nr:peptidylprolyl isomerase [Pseudomonadota bacterium]
MHFFGRIIRYLLLFSAAAVLTGCNRGATLDAATPVPETVQTRQQNDGTAQTAAAEEEPAQAESGARIIRKPTTVSRKGNYIRVVVNNQPITNYDVERRVKFLGLRRLKATNEAAIEELIDQQIKLEEAAKRQTLASDNQVDEAFARFAQSNRSTPTRIAADLDKIGVGAKHFKEFIRTQISWSRAVGSKLQAETQSTSQGDALFEIRKSGSDKPETTEYTLQQIVFVIPSAKRKELLKSRKSEALAFAQRFTGCDDSFDLAKALRDVTVRDLGRKLLPELPPEWSDEIQKTEIGKATGPKETDLGIELYAVCDARVVADDRTAQVVTQSNAYDSIEDKGNAVADELLAELRKSAVIIYK